MNQSLIFNDDFKLSGDLSTITFSGMASGRQINVVVTFVNQPSPTSHQVTQALKLDLEALVEDWTEDNDLDEITEIQLRY
ncbi:hypothetical protein FE810_08920 [Thalassotalea litorea]|uniref:Uncharacterized protein n=1 Tax=Thalassotalea litorea TaxID=2020715 RepID=A0A5R9ITY4_9GAMM|nr:hypothetical protein [Thalassotalea litorea]TLU65398.1 hypothetical protein FE810_08920 [Thalassotalea litorea]